jgi:hypothetical protein
MCHKNYWQCKYLLGSGEGVAPRERMLGMVLREQSIALSLSITPSLINNCCKAKARRRETHREIVRGDGAARVVA